MIGLARSSYALSFSMRRQYATFASRVAGIRWPCFVNGDLPRLLRSVTNINHSASSQIAPGPSGSDMNIFEAADSDGQLRVAIDFEFRASALIFTVDLQALSDAYF